MQLKNSAHLVLAAAVAAVAGIILSAIFIKAPLQHQSVVSAVPIPASFPDVKNDPTYKSFLNPNAIDPTQAVSVGGGQNSAPFGSSQ